MKTELEMNEYVPFIRKWVKQTVDMMSIEEIKSMAMESIHEEMEEILQEEGQREVFNEMKAWNSDSLESIAKDYDLVLELSLIHI